MYLNANMISQQPDILRMRNNFSVFEANFVFMPFFRLISTKFRMEKYVFDICVLAGVKLPQKYLVSKEIRDNLHIIAMSYPGGTSLSH